MEREALHILSVFMPQISFYLLDVLERSAEVLNDAGGEDNGGGETEKRRLGAV